MKDSFHSLWRQLKKKEEGGVRRGKEREGGGEGENKQLIWEDRS